MSQIANDTIRGLVLSTLIIMAVAGCSSPNTQTIIDPDTGKHPANWITDHRTAFPADPGRCAECHGTDLKGGVSGVSCFSAAFNGMSCHANGPSGHPTGWANPDSHGVTAKAAPAASSGFASCQVCHGETFSGGIIQRSCLNTAGCHGAAVSAPHSPAPWRGGTRTHTATNTENASVCALCHLDARTPPSYVPLPTGAQPGCFNSTLCHGDVAAPHPVPFTDPALHGPLAKSDLTYCQGCHADPPTSGAGSNPRFNVSIGSLFAGCENCHATNMAHPTQWRGLTVTAPGGHMTAGNLANACALCHGVNLAPGGVGPACSSCHTAGSPLTLTNCTSCHGNPPGGATYPNQASAHTVHNALPNVTSVCDTCHNGGGTKTANHDYERTSPFVSFLSAYDAKSGAATYNTAAITCSNVSCHGGQITPVWLDGTIDVGTQCTSCHASGTAQYNSYNSGAHDDHIVDALIACTTCHDTTLLAVNHFTHLETTTMEGPASATISSALTYTPGATPGTGSCTPLCHGKRDWQ